MWHFWLFFWILLAVVIILMYCCLVRAGKMDDEMENIRGKKILPIMTLLNYSKFIGL